jgi:predicted acyltransferase
MNKAGENVKLKGRLMSLDALRGLDMFFLVGLGSIFRAFDNIWDNDFFVWLEAQCHHPEWHGFTAWDMVFPMFIFIVGVAMPFSFARRMQEEDGKRKLFRHVVIRTVILIVLGLVRHMKPFGIADTYGFYSVLYRIAFSYFFAALIMMNTNIKGQAYWAFGLLAGYFLMLRFIPVPGYGMGDYSYEGCLKTYLVNQVSIHLSPHLGYVFSISLITSIPNALFGVLAGHWLMSEKTQAEKTRWLLIAGIVFIAAALLLNLVTPINKKLGTSSFTFLSCGITGFLLGLFYWLIDVRGYRKWAFWLVVVGVNPITIYLASSFVKFGDITRVFVGGFDFGNAQALMFAIVLAAIKWLFLYYLWRQRIFLKI